MYKLTAVEAATKMIIMADRQDAINNCITLDNCGRDVGFSLRAFVRVVAARQACADMAKVPVMTGHINQYVRNARFCMVNLLVAEQLARDTVSVLSEYDSKADFVVNLVHDLLTEVQPAFNKLVSSYVWARNVIVPTVEEFASIWGEMEYLDNEDSSENAGEAEYNAHFSLAFDTVNAFTHNTTVYDELCEMVDWADEKLSDAQSRAVGLLTAIENALATAQFMFKDAPETVKPVFNEAAQDVTAKIIECYNKHLVYSKSTKQMNDFVNQFREFPPEECRL